MNFKKKHLALNCLAVLGIMSIAAPALAVNVQDPTIFELGPGNADDESGVTNILGNSVDTGPDWADLFTVTEGVVSVNASAVTSFGGSAAAFVQDDVSAGSLVDRTVYAGKTSDKNNFLIADWDWGTSSVPAKDDITNAYTYSKFVNGHKIIYAGAEREDPSGSSHIDIEYFQFPVSLDEEPPCNDDATDPNSCLFEGTKTPGDILVSMEFRNGGALGSVEIRRRNLANNGYDLLYVLEGEGCNPADSHPLNTICAYNNASSISGADWPNYDNHAAQITYLPARAFTEFGIDITEMLGGTTPCFSTVQVKTRSSPSFTAELKDFALSSFEECVAHINTEIYKGATRVADDYTSPYPWFDPSAVSAGDVIYDKAIVTGIQNGPAPTGNVRFERYSSQNCSGTPSEQVVALSASSPYVAQSTNFTTTKAAVSYKAYYLGDSNYLAGPEGYHAASRCEQLPVNAGSVTISTVIKVPGDGSVMGEAIDIGDNSTSGFDVLDEVTLQGNLGFDPTGSVTFFKYQTGNCSGPSTTETVAFSADTDPNNTGTKVVVSSIHDLNTGAADQAGSFLSYQAVYSGDVNYEPVFSTTCEDLCAYDKGKTLTSEPSITLPATASTTAKKKATRKSKSQAKKTW